MVANKCRNPQLRSEAEKLLDELAHRVDGLWDSRAALGLSQWARRMEESYTEHISDPEEVWNKVRQRYVIFDDDHDKATVGSQQLQDGCWISHEEVIAW